MIDSESYSKMNKGELPRVYKDIYWHHQHILRKRNYWYPNSEH